MVLVSNIEAYCSNNDITEAEFERKCDLGKGIVCRWRNGLIKAPTMTTLQKIETATRIPMSRWIKKGGIHAKEG